MISIALYVLNVLWGLVAIVWIISLRKSCTSLREMVKLQIKQHGEMKAKIDNLNARPMQVVEDPNRYQHVTEIITQALQPVLMKDKCLTCEGKGEIERIEASPLVRAIREACAAESDGSFSERLRRHVGNKK